MDLKKPIGLPNGFDFKKTLKSTGLNESKFSLVFLIVSFSFSIIFIYLSINRYGNQSIFSTLKTHYGQTLNENINIENKYRKLIKENTIYFNDLASAPKSKMELSDMMTQLISNSNLRLSKMNLISPDPSKGDILEVEIDGTYLNIIRFSEDFNKLIAPSELLTYKLTKNKEGSNIHLTIAVKYNNPPLSDKLPKNTENNFSNKNLGQKVNQYISPDNNMKFMKIGFVPTNPDITNNKEEITNDKKVIKDPFQAPAVSNNPLKNINNSKNSETTYFLSGILYSKESKLCILTLTSGESKIFSEGGKINNLLKIIVIDRNYIILNASNKKIYVGDEAL